MYGTYLKNFSNHIFIALYKTIKPWSLAKAFTFYFLLELLS